MEYTYTKNNIKITNIKKLNFIYFIYNIYIYNFIYNFNIFHYWYFKNIN